MREVEVWNVQRKKVKMDDVDIFVKYKRLSLEAENMSSMNTNTSKLLEYSYWESPEAKKLFNVRKDEEVLYFYVPGIIPT